MKYYELINQVKNKGELSGFLFLITEISGLSKAKLYANLHQEIPEKVLEKINAAIDEYVNKKRPVQYIIGHTYFYRLKIFVDENVLIPRPETEEVVERGIMIAQEYSNPKILDLCTGSGCIAIAIKKNIPEASVTAIDISEKALAVAEKNARFHQAEITFIQNDLLMGIDEKYDIIISNPPYIDKNEKIMPLVYDNEPHIALFSANYGLYHYQKILENAHHNLSENGVIIFEIADHKQEELKRLAERYFKKIDFYRDIRQKMRMMVVR